jgi:hypothetical protein
MADKIPSSGKTTESGRSGNSGGDDTTTQPGQYPPGGWGNAIFGGPLPDGTGAPGTQGGGASPDPTNQPGQVSDGLTGITDAEITETGAPGTQGAVVQSGGSSSVTYTHPNDGIGPYESVTRGESLSGPGDSTMANDAGYATGGPQLPAIKGNEPEAGGSRFQPGGGKVMRGGRAVRP